MTRLWIESHVGATHTDYLPPLAIDPSPSSICTRLWGAKLGKMFVAAEVGRLPMIHLTVSPSASPPASPFLLCFLVSLFPDFVPSYLLCLQGFRGFRGFRDFPILRVISSVVAFGRDSAIPKSVTLYDDNYPFIQSPNKYLYFPLSLCLSNE